MLAIIHQPRELGLAWRELIGNVPPSMVPSSLNWVAEKPDRSRRRPLRGTPGRASSTAYRGPAPLADRLHSHPLARRHRFVVQQYHAV